MQRTSESVRRFLIGELDKEERALHEACEREQVAAAELYRLSKRATHLLNAIEELRAYENAR